MSSSIDKLSHFHLFICIDIFVKHTRDAKVSRQRNPLGLRPSILNSTRERGRDCRSRRRERGRKRDCSTNIVEKQGKAKRSCRTKSGARARDFLLETRGGERFWQRDTAPGKRGKRTVLSFETRARVNHGKSIRESHAGRRVREATGRGRGRKGSAVPVDDRWRERERERDVSQEETKGFGSTYQPEVVTSPELRGPLVGGTLRFVPLYLPLLLLLLRLLESTFSPLEFVSCTKRQLHRRRSKQIRSSCLPFRTSLNARL